MFYILIDRNSSKKTCARYNESGVERHMGALNRTGFFEMKLWNFLKYLNISACSSTSLNWDVHICYA